MGSSSRLRPPINQHLLQPPRQILLQPPRQIPLRTLLRIPRQPLPRTLPRIARQPLLRIPLRTRSRNQFPIPSLPHRFPFPGSSCPISDLPESDPATAELFAGAFESSEAQPNRQRLKVAIVSVFLMVHVPSFNEEVLSPQFSTHFHNLQSRGSTGWNEVSGLELRIARSATDPLTE